MMINNIILEIQLRDNEISGPMITYLLQITKSEDKFKKYRFMGDNVSLRGRLLKCGNCTQDMKIARKKNNFSIFYLIGFNRKKFY